MQYVNFTFALLVMSLLWVASPVSAESGSFPNDLARVELPFPSAMGLQTEVPRDSSLPDHPRILLLRGEEITLREKVESDPLWSRVHRQILDKCALLLKQAPVERRLVGRRLLDRSREALRRIFYLSYAFRMTGHRAFLARAEEEMRAVAAFPDWNPSHFLDVAEMTMALAIGYDWLFHELSPEAKALIRDSIVQKGLLPSLEPAYSKWTKVDHNWNQVCNAGMAYGALAVYEDHPELSTRILDRAVQSIRLPMGAYQPDGAYPEGYGYWGYGTSFNVLFISGYEKAFRTTFPTTGTEGFLRTAYYILHMVGPTGECFNYSDSTAKATANPAQFWFAEKLKDPSVLYWEKRFLETGKGADDRLLPALLVWGAGIRSSSIPTPAQLMWVGRGKNPVALMRTSWKDPYAIFVGIKGGSPSVNHGHMDVGSFVMEAEGERWAMDFGLQDYNSLEQKGVDLWNMSQNSPRWRVFRYTNFVHNTLTVNGALQKVEGYAPLLSSSSGEDFTHCILDLTSLYQDHLISARRGIAIRDKSYVIVRDEVIPKQNAIVRWTMLTGARVTKIGPTWVELAKNGKKLVLKVTEPSSIKIETWPTVPPHDYDAPNPGTILVGFQVEAPAQMKTILEVALITERVDPEKVEGVGSLDSWPISALTPSSR